MSLPRIAKSALVVAAGAASVVGFAGAATAAELPTGSLKAGLANPDGAGKATSDGPGTGEAGKQSGGLVEGLTKSGSGSKPSDQLQLPVKG